MLTALSILLMPAVNGQTRFDVVAIRENRSPGGDAGMSLRNGILQVNDLYLNSIITSAWGIHELLIFGLPAWAQAARYDIHARVTDAGPSPADGMSREQRRALMAALLQDRFHLKAHVVTKTLPVYDLVVAKDGPKFRNARDSTEPHTDVRKTEFTATRASMLGLSSVLEEIVGRSVIDKTGLAGTYDLHLRWAPDTTTTPDTDTLPSIFTALQEQLGLKLQANKGPVKTLVVDHIERPAEN